MAGHGIAPVGNGHLQKADMKKTEIKKILTLAELDNMPLSERFKLYKERVVSPFKAIKNAQTRATESLVEAGKITASLKREYTTLITLAGAGKTSTITAGTSEAKFFEDYCGGKPSPRVLAVATLFNAMCMTEFDVVVEEGKPPVKKTLLDEKTQFDPHSGNSLEIAAACIAHERKAAPEKWMGTDNTLDVIGALSTPGDATTKLKEIRKRQKGTKETTDGEENPPHTIASCIAFLMAAIQSAGETLKVEGGAEIAADLFKSTYFDMGAAWQTSGVSEETMQKWTSNIERGVAPTMEVVQATSAAPAEPVAA